VSLIPEICLGNNTFSSTERSLSKLENWKINPNFLFLNEEILLSFNVVVLIPSMKIWPFVGLSNNPIMLSNVDFPEPELPTIKTISPCSIENDTLSRAFTLFSPSP